MLHKFDSNSEHTFFTRQVIFGFLLKIVSCDKRLILKEHLTFSHMVGQESSEKFIELRWYDLRAKIV